MFNRTAKHDVKNCQNIPLTDIPINPPLEAPSPNLESRCYRSNNQTVNVITLWINRNIHRFVKLNTTSP